jgi:hypothetical protein
MLKLEESNVTYSASIGKNSATSFRESVQNAIALHSSTDLLTTGRDKEIGLGLQTSSSGLLDKRFRAGHILVRRVGAATNQAGAKSCGPVVGLDRVLESRKRCRKIRRERAVDVRFQLGQIDRDDFVVLGALVGLQQIVRTGRAMDGVGLDSNGTAESRRKVRVVRGRSVREDAGRGADLSTLSRRQVSKRRP